MSMTESAATVNFDQALLQATARAKAVYPAERTKIEKGFMIALSGGVKFYSDGTATVQSQSNAHVWYRTNGRCDCPSESASPGGRCKHKYAVSLVKWAQKYLAQQPPERYWATYERPDGALQQGVAEWHAQKSAFLFIPDDGDMPLYPAQTMLRLGGNIAIAEEQRRQEGDLVKRICGY